MYSPGRPVSAPRRHSPQDCRWSSLDTDRKEGCIRTREHAYSGDGGLAVLYGNRRENGCIVKPPA